MHLSQDTTALAQYVEKLQPWLNDPTVTELCVNRPGELHVERASGWTREGMPFASFLWCQAFAKLVAGVTKQRVNAESPLLSASLPTGERVQVVLPPAVANGTVAITIRRPNGRVWGLEDLAPVACSSAAWGPVRQRPTRARSNSGGAMTPVDGRTS